MCVCRGSFLLPPWRSAALTPPPLGRPSLSHTPTQWLLFCPLTQTFPQKRGRKSFTLFLLTNLPRPRPPPPPHPLRGCTGAEKGYPTSLSPSPQFHTHTGTETCTHIQSEATRSTAVHEVTNWGLCLFKRGWGSPYFVCVRARIRTH